MTEQTPTTPQTPATGSDTAEAGLREQYAALAFNAVAPALKAHDHWLPLTVRQAVADAVLTVRDREMEQLRNDVNRLGLMVDEYGHGAGALTDKIKRLRKAVHVADDGDVTDWQRGYRACSERAIAALDGKEQP